MFYARNAIAKRLKEFGIDSAGGGYANEKPKIGKSVCLSEVSTCKRTWGDVCVCAQPASLAAIVLAIGCVVSLGARTPASPPNPRPESTSLASTVDRTHKGN